MDQDKSKKRSHLSLIISFFIIVGVVVVLLFVFQPAFFHNLLKPSPDKVIARVGQEDLYQRDLNTEMATLPPMKDDIGKKLAYEKLVNDSITLQGGAQDNLITLDPSFYNSLAKDYLKRVSMVNQVKTKLQEQQESLKGSVVTIWFYNTRVSPLGYEKAKQIAYTKISSLHDQVATKTMTAKQAGDQIIADSSLSEVDAAYKSNAYFEFTVHKNEKITLDPQFDSLLWKLSPGQISAVYVAKDSPIDLNQNIKDPSQKIKVEALYMFGVIDKKIIGVGEEYNTWLKNKQASFKVQN